METLSSRRLQSGFVVTQVASRDQTGSEPAVTGVELVGVTGFEPATLRPEPGSTGVRWDRHAQGSSVVVRVQLHHGQVVGRQNDR